MRSRTTAGTADRSQGAQSLAPRAFALRFDVGPPPDPSRVSMVRSENLEKPDGREERR